MTRPRSPKLAPLLLSALAGASLACDRSRGEAEPPEASPASPPACEGAALLDEIWTEARRDALGEALEPLPGDWPSLAASTVTGRVAELGPRWRSSYERACASEDHRAQRCLDAQIWELDALTTVIVEDPERRTPELWPNVSRVLGDPEDCLGREDPGLDVPALPASYGTKLAQLRLLTSLRELRAAGEVYNELVEVPAVTESPSYGYHLMAYLTTIQLLAGNDASQELAWMREAAPELGARERSVLAQISAIAELLAERREAAVAELERALALQRQVDDPWILFWVLLKLGDVEVMAGDFDGASAALTEAVAVVTRHAGAEDPHASKAQVSLARAQLARGEVEPAYDLLLQAREGFSNTLGPDHPETVAVVQAIGDLFMEAGRPADAHFAYLDLLEINTTLYGLKDARTALVRLDLGDALLAMNENAGAEKLFAEALPLLQDALGADHRAVIRAAIHLGIAELAQGKLELAESHCQVGQRLAKSLAEDDSLIADATACMDGLAAAEKQAGGPGKKSRKKAP